jgi:DNA-binding GntR family transcriptional regulator
MIKKAVKPLQDPKDIELIRGRLAGNSRDLLLFDMATQTGLPAKQWLQLKVKHLNGLKIGDSLPLRDGVKAIGGTPLMTAVLYQTFIKFINEKSPHQDDYLFQSNKGLGPLSLPSVSRLVKGWLKGAGLIGMSGLLTLRKTWSVHYRQFKPSPPKATAGENHFDSDIKKILVPTRQEVVFKELEQKIVTGRLIPGQRLVAEEIANQMGVSSIPVREALGRLEARGFISTIPQKGSTVYELSRDNLIEILEIRLFLECLASERAAVRRTEETLNQLEAFHKEYALARKGDDPEKLLSTNKKFHHTIYQAANMPILMDMINQLWGRISPYYHIFFRQSEKPNPTSGIKYHNKIMEGMRRGDPEETCKWLKADLTDSTKFILDLFEIYSKKSIH